MYISYSLFSSVPNVVPVLDLSRTEPRRSTHPTQTKDEDGKTTMIVEKQVLGEQIPQHGRSPHLVDEEEGFGPLALRCFVAYGNDAHFRKP